MVSLSNNGLGEKSNRVLIRHGRLGKGSLTGVILVNDFDYSVSRSLCDAYTKEEELRFLTRYSGDGHSGCVFVTNLEGSRLISLLERITVREVTKILNGDDLKARIEIKDGLVYAVDYDPEIEGEGRDEDGARELACLYIGTVFEFLGKEENYVSVRAA